MTLTETKRDPMETLTGDLPPAGITFGVVRLTELGESGVVPTGMRRAGKQRRRPILTGHRLLPPEAALRTFR